MPSSSVRSGTVPAGTSATPVLTGLSTVRDDAVVEQLRERAQRIGLTGRSQMNEDQLREALRRLRRDAG